MNRITAFELPANEQLECVFFNKFPGEIRDRIFNLTLSCYENPAKTWDRNSSFVRPEYSAPLVADTALLQTCQRIYLENWFRPWVSAIHTFYLAWEGRRPDDKQVMTVEKLQPALDQLNEAHGEVEVSHVRVFAQLCNLESGSDIEPILRMNNFFPRKLTITIRHHDWWNWENDQRLHIGSHWVNVCRFPDSLTELRMELESLQRKSNQIDWIAENMINSWHFERKDGTIMSAKVEDCKVDLWSGSSTWQYDRWLRDETRPGTNEYYVKTVIWQPNCAVTERPTAHTLQVPDTFPVIHHENASIPVWLIGQAKVPADASADETLRLVQTWQEAHTTSDDDNGEDGDDDDETDGSLAAELETQFDQEDSWS